MFNRRNPYPCYPRRQATAHAIPLKLPLLTAEAIHDRREKYPSKNRAIKCPRPIDVIQSSQYGPNLVVARRQYYTAFTCNHSLRSAIIAPWAQREPHLSLFSCSTSDLQKRDPRTLQLPNLVVTTSSDTCVQPKSIDKRRLGPIISYFPTRLLEFFESLSAPSRRSRNASRLVASLTILVLTFGSSWEIILHDDCTTRQRGNRQE